MKVSKVSIRHARTINMGNYQSLNVEVTMEADVQDHEDVNEVCSELSNKVHVAYEFELNRSVVEFRQQAKGI